jgi:PAS domain S-box-containing protein
VIELSTYVFETLREDGELVLYRCRRESDGSSVLLVEPVSEHPSLRSLKQLEHEYSIKEVLHPDWAARPIALERSDGRTRLLLEDPGGEPLCSLRGRPLELREFLRLAIALAGTLGKLHAAGLIHKKIKPANILAEAATANVWLTGFGISSGLRRERHPPEQLESLPGTLAYIAPEQTGRMNRSVDSRSDLYSYGATLYEMLTGVLPFTASEPMEWVHGHIARRPIPPRDRVEQISETISAIVMKLLAKASEERYQTAAGVEADLRRCLAEVESLSRIDPFPLGAHDVSDRLLIPERLYGRDRESEALRNAFERVASSGKPELVLVSGYSGVGKSSVVNELQKAIVLPRGIFISGKFDQSKRDIPYATFAQAFQSLARQILAETDEEVAPWRQAIREAAGPNGQLLIDLIPELELIIGKQPAVPDLHSDEARNRFHTVFRRFLAACAREEHPLALFIDDLQWLDGATIELLQQLVTDPDLRHFLLVGAYRDNEVTRSHPMMLMLDSIRQSGAIVSEIVLNPLSLADMCALLSDAVHADRFAVQPLAQLLKEKTAGNPFFAIQFLTGLADEHLLEFDVLKGVWEWDLDRIRAKGFSENVVDLMVGKLERLPFATQEGLKRLACLGSSAPTALLTILHGGSEEELHSDLWEAVQAGFVFRLDRFYKLSHDRIQEAAYALIPDESRAEVHLRIGRLLHSRMTPEEIAENIFSVVNELNAGVALITNRKEKERIAELNLAAGKKAKASAAYAATCTYLSVGMTLIGRNGWEGRYGLALNLWLERAECEFLTGNFETAEQLISEVLQKGRSKIDKAAAYRLRIQLYVMKTQNAEAVDIALECLRLFGIEMPPHPTREQVQTEYEEVWKNLEGRSIASLIELPPMCDPEMHAAMSVLSALFAPAFNTDSNLLRLLICHMVNVSLKYGTTDASTHGYAWFGLVLGPVFHRYEDAYRFGKLAIDLVEKYNFVAWKAKVYFVMEMVLLWSQPLKTAIEFIRTAFRTGVEIGDVTFACYSGEHIVTDLLLRGEHLDQVWLESVKARDFALNAKFQDVADVILSIQRFVQHLRGRTVGFSSFDVADEQAFEAQLAESRMATKVCWYWILKLRARFMSGDYVAAIAAAQKAKVLLWASECHIQLLDYCYYSALAAAAFYQEAPPAGKNELLDLLIEHLAQLEEWAENCPSTFRDKYILAAAEFARIEGRDLDAMRLYEDAIKSAHENGFVQNEGIACELAAKFYLKQGFERIAISYIRDARNCYLAWGALGKAKQLDELYPCLEEQEPERPARTNGAPVDQLDLVAVVSASQAVSGAILLDKLIETLMVITVEHAGAERGILILARNGISQIEAEAVTGVDKVEVYLRQEPVSPATIPESILHYVVRTGQKVILDDAMAQNLFSSDAYVKRRRPRSILCLPITKQGELMGILYLENNLTPCAFTPDRQAVLELLASQAAISLENAQLYADLTQENADRKKAEEAVRASQEELNWLNRTLQTLYQCNRALIHASDEQELFQSVCQILVEVGGLRLAWVGRCENDIEKTVRPIAKAGYAVDYLEQVKISWGEETEMGRGPTGIALRTGKPYWVKDSRIDPALAPWRTDAIARGYGSCVTLPLIVDGNRLGSLSLYGAEPNAFNESTIEQYTDLANNLAYGVRALRTREERKRAEEALRESEQRLQDVIDNTTAVVFVKDLDLRYILVNREYERCHHVQRDQIRGKTDFDIHPHDFAERVRANDLRVIKAGAPIQFEETVQAVGGERHYVVVKFLLRDRTGKPYAICGIATDITELAKTNEALLKCLDAIASVPKLDEFLGQVMAAITRQLGAASSALRWRNHQQNCLTLDFVFQEGRVMNPSEAKYPEDFQSIPLDKQQLGMLRQPATVMHLLDNVPAIPDPHRSYLVGLGFKTLLIIPLVIARQLIGSLTFRFSEDREFHPEEIEIARALASQASLAIQLTRLAKAARQSAVLEERNQLAGEIHDSLAQFFTGISMQLGAAREVIKAGSGNILTYLERASELAQFGLAEARRSAFSLQPSIIEESGLVEALQKLVERSNIPGRLRCNFYSTGLPEETLPPSVQHDLLRIAQEAMSNAVRHAKPTVVSVSLRCNPSGLVLEVTDNGSGIADSQGPSNEGFGFSNMRARAENIGAELEVRTAAGRGTTVLVHLPMNLQIPSDL